jgi:hypothetical protein
VLTTSSLNHLLLLTSIHHKSNPLLLWLQILSSPLLFAVVFVVNVVLFASLSSFAIVAPPFVCRRQIKNATIDKNSCASKHMLTSPNAAILLLLLC